jgi:hypothetical protein
MKHDAKRIPTSTDEPVREQLSGCFAAELGPVRLSDHRNFGLGMVQSVLDASNRRHGFGCEAGFLPMLAKIIGRHTRGTEIG